MEASIDDPLPLVENIITQVSLSVTTWQYVAEGLALFILLGLSAMISGSEVAYFSLSHDDIVKLRASPEKGEKKIVDMLTKPKRLLATILILNNFVNIAIVTLATYVSWQIVGSKSTEGTLVATVTFASTFAIVFFGEIVPKVYANENNINFAKIATFLIAPAYYFFKPVSFVLTSMSYVVERRMEKKGFNISVDDLNQALELTAHQDATEEEKGILKGIVNFGTLSVTQVMRSRMDIVAVDIEEDFHVLMDLINKNGYSRIPVYKETIDKIEGVLYVKDLLPFVEEEDHFQWQTLLRPAFFIPESKKIDALLKDFQEKRIHLAIVVDEYGGTSGLITLEDVIEEIVGEINDEFDEEIDVAFNKIDDHTYIFEGKTSLNDFCKIINQDVSIFDPVRGESESLGGLLLEINAKLPRSGEKINFDKFVFTIVAVDQKRIKRVRVYMNPQFVSK